MAVPGRARLFLARLINEVLFYCSSPRQLYSVRGRVRKRGCSAFHKTEPNNYHICITLYEGQWPKTGIRGPFEAKNRYILKSSQKRTLRTSPTIGPKRIVPVFGRIKPRYTRVCLLCLTFNRSLSFFSQSKRPSIVAPDAPHTNADLRRDHFHPPHPTPRHTRARHV